MERSLKTLIQCFTLWHLAGSPDLSRADSIITHAGGEALDGSPGEINLYLREIVHEIYEQYHLPIIAEGELADCLGLPLAGRFPRHSEMRPGEYPTSIPVAEFHVEVCKRNGWKRPVLLSYQPHMWRALMVTLKLGYFEEIFIANVPRHVYDKNCSQRWMADPWFNNPMKEKGLMDIVGNTPRELGCRLLWWQEGKI